MRVFYDARWIPVDDRFDGVGRYSYELAHALSHQPDIELVWIIHDRKQLNKLPKGESILANNPNNGLAELRLPRLLNRAGAKVVYSPFFIMGTIGKKYKLILTIHDMIYFNYRTPPQWLPQLTRFGWWLFHLTYLPLRWQLNRADHITTVSQTAREELLTARATKRIITTVPNAAGDAFTAPDSDHASKQSVVYAGSFTPYKNVECLIEAIALVPDITLDLLGKLPDSRRPEIEAHIRAYGVEDRVILHGLANGKEYRKALANARCVMSASRIEGFGLPLIEAQQAGVPVAVADTPIFHEVGGDSVLFFNPDSPEEAAHCIRALGDKATSEDLVRRGRKNAARYTWEASAKIAATCIRKLS